MIHGKTHQFGAVAGVGFAQEAADVFFDGAGTEMEAIANLVIRQPIGEKGQHPLFSRRQIEVVDHGDRVGFVRQMICYGWMIKLRLRMQPPFRLN